MRFLWETVVAFFPGSSRKFHVVVQRHHRSVAFLTGIEWASGSVPVVFTVGRVGLANLPLTVGAIYDRIFSTVNLENRDKLSVSHCVADARSFFTWLHCQIDSNGFRSIIIIGRLRF